MAEPKTYSNVRELGNALREVRSHSFKIHDWDLSPDQFDVIPAEGKSLVAVVHKICDRYANINIFDQKSYDSSGYFIAKSPAHSSQKPVTYFELNNKNIGQYLIEVVRYPTEVTLNRMRHS